MYYADRLMELPSGVLGVALGTILLPMLAKTYSNKDRHEYSRLLDWGLRLCFLLVLPCSLALAILAEPLTVSLFQYGKFTTVDAAMTSARWSPTPSACSASSWSRFLRRASMPSRTSVRQ